MQIKKNKLTIRTLENGDRLLLAKWLSDPEVLKFYGGRDSPFDPCKVQEVFYQKRDRVSHWIAVYENVAIGHIQYYSLNEKERAEYGCSEEEMIYGIDQFIGETEYWNRGTGTLMITLMIDFLISEKEVATIVLDPQIENKRAIRCYEKCGFTIVKELPSHEWHEGKYRDAYLMEINKNHFPKDRNGHLSWLR